MLMLIVEAGGRRYGVPASRIVEVLPVPVLRPLPGMPAFFPGVFSYHSHIVPVMDLSALLTGRPAPLLLSTRIVLVRAQPLRTGGPVLLGLLAEHATETLACTREEFQPAGVQSRQAPYAGDILVRPDGLIQELNVDRVLTAEIQDQLFGVPA
jgi:chemotaxis-related protein WspB